MNGHAHRFRDTFAVELLQPYVIVSESDFISCFLLIRLFQETLYVVVSLEQAV